MMRSHIVHIRMPRHLPQEGDFNAHEGAPDPVAEKVHEAYVAGLGILMMIAVLIYGVASLGLRDHKISGMDAPSSSAAGATVR
jgi:hypothetical protein